MLQIRCTIKLLKTLGPTVALAAEAEDDPHLGSWFANLVHVERRKCVLFTHSISLYSFLVPDVKVAEIRNTRTLFLEHLGRSLALHEIDPSTLDLLAARYSEYSVLKTNSRSVLGSMNDMLYQLEGCLIEENGLAPAAVAAFNHMVNRMPMSPIGYSYAVDQMKKWIGGLSD
jgi:hypothetical protein